MGVKGSRQRGERKGREGIGEIEEGSGVWSHSQIFVFSSMVEVQFSQVENKLKDKTGSLK